MLVLTRKRNQSIVVNDNIEDAVNKIDAILLSSKCSVERIEDLELDNEEDDKLYDEGTFGDDFFNDFFSDEV